MWKCLKWSGWSFTEEVKYKGYYNENNHLILISNDNKHIKLGYILKKNFKDLNYFSSTFGRLKSIFL